MISFTLLYYGQQDSLYRINNSNEFLIENPLNIFFPEDFIFELFDIKRQNVVHRHISTDKTISMIEIKSGVSMLNFYNYSNK